MEWDRALAELRPALVARAQKMLGGRHYGAGAPTPDDLAQVTLEKLLRDDVRRELEKESTESLRRWAFRALHNALIDACDRKKRETLWSETSDDEEAPEPPATEPSPEARVLAARDWRDRRARLTAALATLDAQERSFLEVCMRENSAPRAQEILGWPPGTPANACQRRNSLVRRLQAAAVSSVEAPPLRLVEA